MKSEFVDVNGVRLNYGEGAANGPKLVFIPGFPRNWTEYGPLLEALKPYFHVFAPTMRGQGLSQWSAPYLISSYIDDTAAFLHHIVGDSALGVGHSAGAWFGLASANDSPELFTAFISLDQPLDPNDHVAFHGKDSSPTRRMLDAMRAATSVEDLQQKLSKLPSSGGRSWSDEMSDEELRDKAVHLRSIDPETFAPWADGLEDWIVIPELQRWPGKYHNPLLFLDGEMNGGSMLTPKAVEYNLSHYPWAERIEMKNLDHVMGLRDTPGPASAEIRRFFDGLS